MPAIYTTTVDALLIGDGNIDDIRVDDLLLDAPFLAALGVKAPSNGTQHEYLKHTAAPGVGFRPMNTGQDNTKGTRTKETAFLKYLDASFSLDRGLYESPSGEALWTDEASLHLKAALAQAEKQLIYGVDVDSGGFAGLAGLSTLDDSDDPFVINAGGSGTDLSSAFLVRAGQTDICLLGPDAQIQIDIDDPFDTIELDEDGKPFNVKRTPIAGWMGLQLGGRFSVSRIANLNVSHGGSKPLTDDLIARAIALHKTNRPTHVVMNFDAAESLRQSRIATNDNGRPAPPVEEVYGLKVVVTDAINTGETALTAA